MIWFLRFYYRDSNGKVKRKWRFPEKSDEKVKISMDKCRESGETNSKHFYVFRVGFPVCCYKMKGRGFNSGFPFFGGEVIFNP